MKEFNEKIRQEVEIQLGIETFEILSDTSIMVNGREKYQVVTEDDATEVIEDFMNYDGSKSKYFEFDGITYYFILQ